MDANLVIPFLDLVTPHLELEQDLSEVFCRSLSTAGFIGGVMVEGFEQSFATFCGTRHAVGVSSGTDALRFALMACGIQSGDAVVTVPNTFIATTEAITQAGAAPEFVDIDENTYTISIERLRHYLANDCTRNQFGRLISRRSKRLVTAVIPVHIYGQMADMDPILDLAEEYGIAVIEDACQAHGAEYFSRKRNCWMTAGSMGRVGAFSFYPGKNLGACGEAGAVTTDDGDIAARVRMLRDHGQVRKYYHDVEGYNGRLDAIQAGILSVKLKYLARWNGQRRAGARVYDELLEPFRGIVTIPGEASYSKSVYHLYVVRTSFRNELQAHLTDAGIGTGIHYPIPLHLQNAYAWMDRKIGEYPESEKAANQILSLPMFPGLTLGQQGRVAEAISQFAAKHASC